MTPDDLTRYGTDKQLREFIQRQPSCISGRFSEHLESGEGRCVAAHVRRAATSGMGYKGPYSCIPVRQEEHLTQHQHGELACLTRHMPRRQVIQLIYGLSPQEQATAAKRWFDEQVLKYRRLWVESLGGAAAAGEPPAP